VHGTAARIRVRRAADETVSGNVPDNWKQVANVGTDAILTDYPLELRATLKLNSGK
jgi:hypothetical protein